MSRKEIAVRLRAMVSDYRADLSKAAQTTREFGHEVATAAASGNEALRTLGRGAAVAGAATLAGVGLSIKAFGDFDQAMAGSLAIMGDLSDFQRRDLSQAARDVATTTRFSAREAAGAYFFLASAGLDAAQSLSALPKVAAFAQAGNFDLARATDLLTDAQSALGLASDDTREHMLRMTRVSDVLVKANVLANASVAQFSEALTNRAGAALRLLNKDMEEGVAVLATFADQGVKGSEAGERLNIVLRDLQTSSIRNRSAWDELGLSVFDSSGKMRNIADIVDDLSGALEGASDEQSRMTLMQLGFQDRSVSAIMTLLGLGDAIRGYEEELRRAGGVTDEVANRQIQNLNDQAGIAKDKIVDLAIDFGERLAPAIAMAIGWISGAADALGDLPDPIKTIIAFAVPLVGVALSLGGGFLLLVPRIVKTRQALNALSATAPRLVAALRTIPMALGVVGIALVGLTAIFSAFNRSKQQAQERAQEFLDALEAEEDGLDGATDALIRNKLISADLVTTLGSVGVTVDDVTRAVKGDADALEEVGAKIQALGHDDRWEVLVQLRHMSDAFETATETAEELEAQQRLTNAAAIDAGIVFDNEQRAAANADTAISGLHRPLRDHITDIVDLRVAWDEAEGSQRAYYDAVLAGTDPVFRAVDAIQRQISLFEELSGKAEITAADQLELSRTTIEVARAMNSMDPSEVQFALAVIAESLGTTTGGVRDLLAQFGIFVDEAGNIGAGISGGILDGLGDLGGRLGDRLTREIQRGVDRTKKAFGISSPSLTVAAEIGEPIAEGVALGIRSKAQLPGEELRRVLGTMITSQTAPVIPDISGELGMLRREIARLSSAGGNSGGLFDGAEFNLYGSPRDLADKTARTVAREVRVAT